MATGTPEDEMYVGDASDPRAAPIDRGVGHQVSTAFAKAALAVQCYDPLYKPLA